MRSEIRTCLRRLPAVVFALFLMTTTATNAFGADPCSDDQYAVHPELLQKAFDKVAQERLNQAGRAALLKMYKSGISTSPNHLNKLLKNLPTVMTAIEATDAIAAGDFDKLKSMSINVAAEQTLTALGVPLVGEMMATFEVVKLSYQELRHQTCLLNIDMAYYRFLDDKKLQEGDQKQIVDYYLNKYIHGEGRDPQGQPIDINRQYLQCFVDEELPGQNIKVDFSEMSPFDRFVQATQVSAGNPGLRTAVMVMLSDFKTRRKIEEMRQKALAYSRRTDFQVLKETLPVLGSYPLLQEWICSEYLALVKEREGAGAASPASTPPPPADLNESIVILLDASGSMRDNNRMEQAKRSALAVLKKVSPGTEMALIVFAGCGGIKVVQEFTTDAQAIEAVLPGISPGGDTPLAAATTFAKKYIKEKARGKSARVVILTDGKDTCGGDPVHAAASE